MPDQIPDPLAQWIDEYVESLMQLEALFLLRNEPQRAWECGEVAKALYISRDMCDAQLAGLERRGFLQRTPLPDSKYVYQPRDPALARRVDELHDVYLARRVAVIARIYSKPVNKVQTFADAFRLRKED